jgi:NAD+ kinase
MRFGVVANFERPDAAETVSFVVDWCRRRRHDVFICNCAGLKQIADVPVISSDELGRQADIVISMGGDGTILASARALYENEIPILGINLGYLGFLTQLTPDQLEEALEKVVSRAYRIEERFVIRAEAVNAPSLEFPYALNDIVIDKGNVSRVINLSLYANEEYISSYTADGLIVATPTGSTAYSLAVGGPILNPTMQAFIISPISPFSLTSRPLVFPPDFSLVIKVRSEHGDAMLTIDGQVATRFSPTGSIKVTAAGHRVKLIVFEDNSFYDILRRKLHWGKLPVVDYKKADFLKEDPQGGQY